MNNAFEPSSTNPAIAILGVPFDPVTMTEAIAIIGRMVASRRPHYVVTANVDFLAQARGDIELRRILMDAHLVLCDGTPVVWASRLLGNPLPERVAGADLVPQLIRIASEKNLRLFFLGGTPESMERAMAKVKTTHPKLQIDGYSPPFNHLLEMDHDEIKRRIAQARPDILFVCFGCPKQEKWIAMHYQSLGVPVAIGVGGTIDFLAGQLKRAPVWMQRSGTEWVFRLLQEPRRLFRRYARDLWLFGALLLAQWWAMQLPKAFRWRAWEPKWLRPETVSPPGGKDAKVVPNRALLKGKGAWARSFIPKPKLRNDLKKEGQASSRLKSDAKWQWIQLPASLDVATVKDDPLLCDPVLADCRDCLLQMDRVELIDSTGMAWLMRLHKKIRATGRHLVLVARSVATKRALKLVHLEDFFASAPDFEAAQRMLKNFALEQGGCVQCRSYPARRILPKQVVSWRGEITAANADPVWNATEKLMLPGSESLNTLVIDLSQVRFMDSSGLGLMVRARRLARQRGLQLNFSGVQPPVLNVLRIARLESFLLKEKA
ncbi:MAG TPA: WecB/TagA/CpsF family glycosyltransferase [Verrucomicrobiae bacterium]|nr:WecB/TagA/CpsF family glycosyltransferase [Verrucomicrobiae bacterium]